MLATNQDFHTQMWHNEFEEFQQLAEFDQRGEHSIAQRSTGTRSATESDTALTRTAQRSTQHSRALHSATHVAQHNTNVAQ